jgi:MFS family permease
MTSTDLTSHGLSPRDRRLSLAAVIACITSVGIGLGVSIPLLAIMLERQGVSSTLIGLNTAMPALATLVATPFISPLLRRVSTGTFLLVCLGVSALCMPLYFQFPNVWAWFPIRFVNGLALTGLFVVSEFWINQLADDKNRGLLMGIYGTILSSGFAVGPLVLLTVGSEGISPFLIVSMLTLFSTVPILIARQLAPQVTEKPSRGLLAFLTVAPAATLAGLVYGATETNIFNMLPIYGMRVGLTEEVAALILAVFALGNMIFNIPIGIASDRFDRRTVLLICAAFGFGGTALLPVVSQNVYVFLPTLFIFGGVVVGMYTVGLAMLGERFKGADLAAANTAFVLMFSVGALVGPPIAGVAMDAWDPHGLAIAMATICGLYLLIVGWRWSGSESTKQEN